MTNNSSIVNVTYDVIPGVPVVTWDKYVIGAVLYFITLVTIVGNVLVLIAVKVNKKLQTTFNYYIVNLAITDIAVAVTAMSFQATHTVLGYWPFGEVLCGLWIFFDYGMTFVSVFTLMLISGDRFWSVAWSVHFRQHHSKKKCLLAIIMAWVFMLVMWIPPWIMDRIRYSEPNVCFWDPSLNTEFVFIIASLGHHGPYAFMVFCYTYVFIFMRKRVKVGDTHFGRSRGRDGSSLRSCTASKQAPTTSMTLTAGSKRPSTNTPTTVVSNITGETSSAYTCSKAAGKFLKPPNNLHISQPTISNEQSGETRQRRENIVFITLTYIIVAYGVLWLPFHVVFDISIVDPTLVPEPVLNLAFWMAYVNSTINPLLYNFSSAEFRKTFKDIILGKYCR